MASFRSFVFLVGAFAAALPVIAQTQVAQNTASGTPAAQAPVPTPTTTPSSEVVPAGEPVIPAVEDKRAYGVLPNYRTAEAATPFHPITNHQKLMIGVKDSFDGVAYPLAAFFTGIGQLTNSNPSFGQGTAGFARRYATAFTDQVAGNMLSESLLPIAFHEDPRFFRKGTGKILPRILYAATRVIICRNDRGSNTFNASEIVGNSMVGILGNAYYPDSRGVSQTLQRAGTQIGTDTISNVLKEFWPDVKEHFIRKHREKLEREGKISPTGGF